MTAGLAPEGLGPGEKQPHANLQHWLSFFCSSAITEASLGVIQPHTPEEACGFLGCMVIETGSGAGRGAMQYTGVRRTAYDAARLQAIASGDDPNSNAWQEQYFAQECAGLHDPQQGSLIGWSHVFEDRPAGMEQAEAAAYWTGSAAMAEGYFRPGTPHTERRQAEARRLWGLLQRGELQLPPAGA